MTCPMDTWIIHLRTVVLAYEMGIIWIETLGVKLKLLQVLGLNICILQALDLIQSNLQRKSRPWYLLPPM